MNDKNQIISLDLVDLVLKESWNTFLQVVIDKLKKEWNENINIQTSIVSDYYSGTFIHAIDIIKELKK